MVSDNASDSPYKYGACETEFHTVEVETPLSTPRGAPTTHAKSLWISLMYLAMAASALALGYGVSIFVAIGTPSLGGVQWGEKQCTFEQCQSSKCRPSRPFMCVSPRSSYAYRCSMSKKHISTWCSDFCSIENCALTLNPSDKDDPSTLGELALRESDVSVRHARTCSFRDCERAQCDISTAPYLCTEPLNPYFYRVVPDGCSAVPWGSSVWCGDSCDLTDCALVKPPLDEDTCSGIQCPDEICQRPSDCGSGQPYQV